MPRNNSREDHSAPVLQPVVIHAYRPSIEYPDKTGIQSTDMNIYSPSRYAVALQLIVVFALSAGCSTVSINIPFEKEQSAHMPYTKPEIMARRELPDLLEYPILPPDMNYRYFNGISRFPFEPEATDFSYPNAWILSDAAFLAYCHPGYARMAWEIAGFGNFHFITGSEMECMIAWNDSSVIISFRGTELHSLSTLTEVLTDLNTAPASFPSGGSVHKGFLAAFESLWEGENGLKEFICGLIENRPERPVWITGHSLGGALAALCFASMPEAAGCYIYGSPKIGNPEFTALFDDRQLWRVEYNLDPVFKVPFDAPALKFYFGDAGSLVYISESGEIGSRYPGISLEDQEKEFQKRKAEREERIAELLRQPGPHKTKLLFAELYAHLYTSEKERREYLENMRAHMEYKFEDHMPVNYSTHLWNALLARTRKEEGED